MTNSHPKFQFSPSAIDTVTIYDVIMAFELLLGRNPEAASVINLKMAEGFPKMIDGILGSNEFREKIVLPIRSQRQVKRADSHAKPSEDQISWLFTYISLDEEHQRSLLEAGTWSEFFRRLLLIGGVDVGQHSSKATGAIDARTETQTAPSAPLQDARSAAAHNSNVNSLLVRLGDFRDLLSDIEKALRASQQ